MREGRFVTKMPREYPGPEVHFNLTGYSSIIDAEALGVAKSRYGDMDG